MSRAQERQKREPQRVGLSGDDLRRGRRDPFVERRDRRRVERFGAHRATAISRSIAAHAASRSPRPRTATRFVQDGEIRLGHAGSPAQYVADPIGRRVVGERQRAAQLGPTIGAIAVEYVGMIAGAGIEARQRIDIGVERRGAEPLFVDPAPRQARTGPTE